MDVDMVFLASIIETFRSNKRLADRAIAQVSDERLRIPLDANTNSLAIIMKHVSGNLTSRWSDFLTSDGEKPWRNRDDEFIDTFASRQEILQCWERGWSVLFASLEQLTADDLGKQVEIRGEPHSIPLALSRSLAHTCYHVGQIVQLARVMAEGEWET